MTLRDAVALSRNRITAQVMEKVGPSAVARLARDMGVRESPLERVPSLALGTSPVTLKEMVASYATIANGGLYVEPQMVTRIENRQGDVLAEYAPAPPERALDTETDKTLLCVMRDVVTRGTGSSIPPAAASARASGFAATWPARPVPRRTTRTAGSS
jgi:penicillin-binding protein 1A